MQSVHERLYPKEKKKEALCERPKERLPLAHEEIPIGCVIVKDGEIIDVYTTHERNCSERSHAEVMATKKPISMKRAGVCWIPPYL